MADATNLKVKNLTTPLGIAAVVMTLATVVLAVMWNADENLIKGLKKAAGGAEGNTGNLVLSGLTEAQQTKLKKYKV